MHLPIKSLLLKPFACCLHRRKPKPRQTSPAPPTPQPVAEVTTVQMASATPIFSTQIRRRPDADGAYAISVFSSSTEDARFPDTADISPLQLSYSSPGEIFAASPLNYSYSSLLLHPSIFSNGKFSENDESESDFAATSTDDGEDTDPFLYDNESCRAIIQRDFLGSPGPVQAVEKRFGGEGGAARMLGLIESASETSVVGMLMETEEIEERVGTEEERGGAGRAVVVDGKESGKGVLMRMLRAVWGSVLRIFIRSRGVGMEGKKNI